MSSFQKVLVGHLDGFVGGSVRGWAWNPDEPLEPVKVSILLNDALVASVLANEFRPDLERAGIGSGNHSFSVSIDVPQHYDALKIQVRFERTGGELANSPTILVKGSEVKRQDKFETLKLDPFNITEANKNLNFVEVEHLLLDINDNCNANCVYCPHTRSKNRMETEQFNKLVNFNIVKVDTLQFGCGQEPTVDPRLHDFYDILRKSTLRPNQVQMITNAMFLYKHDVRFLRDCGLSILQVSIDTARHDINARTRRGTDLQKIILNMKRFKEDCPDVKIKFSVVVNSETIDGMEELISLENLNVQEYFFREIVDQSYGNRVRNLDYYNWIEKLSLKQGEFQDLIERLQASPIKSKMYFAPKDKLEKIGTEMNREKNVYQSI